MEKKVFSKPLSLCQMTITDEFWQKEMEIVRKELIPYQWKALNDQIKDAQPSFCIRNFEVAGRQNEQRKEEGESYEEPKYTFRGFQTLPENMEQLEEKFYGFVFQDSDLYKWLEAVAHSLMNCPDKVLEELADKAIGLICKAQQEDGYLDTYYIINGKDKIFTNLRDHHELYCFGHLAEAAAAYYEATGKTDLLNAAMKFADYIADYFGDDEGKCKGYPGHEIAEMALIRLYEVTGKERYKELSSFFINERGKKICYFDTEEHDNPTGYEYHQVHLPVREQTEAVGHAVRAVYLYSGMADIARLYEDKALFEACKNLWDNIVNEKMYITGGIGATHIGEAFSFSYDLPNDTVYAETCASIGLVFFARRMLQIQPNSNYADVMELALYNSVLSGMALDGKSFFYVNPLEVFPTACKKDERKFHIKPIRQKWFGCACCPPNLARLVSSIGSYSYTENEDTLFVHLYTAGRIKKKLPMGDSTVTITSGFPWDGKVRLTFEKSPAPYTVALRIPGWCEHYTINGDKNAKKYIKDGYVYLTKEWNETDELTITFDMNVCFMEADNRVREDIGKIALMRGPICYCMEEVDNGDSLHLLSVDLEAVPKIYKIRIQEDSAIGIQAEGVRRITEKSNEKCLYHKHKAFLFEKTTLQFIPYYMWGNRGENEMQVWVDCIEGCKK